MDRFTVNLPSCWIRWVILLPYWPTIEEHPHLLKGLASTPFDSEGVRTERRDIIKDGILTQWLLTSYGVETGLKSTGHAAVFTTGGLPDKV